VEVTARNIHLKGLVQGVGFRPFVYRLALKNNITGWVVNGNDGVRIHAEGATSGLSSFISGLVNEAPAASLINEILEQDAPVEDFREFSIRKSQDASEEITDISPDIAVCPECLADLKSQPHRISYPFINCTNCGPRFTIIRDLPYDRQKTTMAPFNMCPTCRSEYSDILDRRFHAQPVACNDCGPEYKLITGDLTIRDIDGILEKCASLLDEGKILAMKGMGGFHLACDALREESVRTMRLKKNREGKPFAVMFSNIEVAREYLGINSVEEEALSSWRRPIVILNNRQGGKELAPGVSNGFLTTGVMLPYMPFHHLLFEKLHTPAIVLTSGNISDEPIIIDNATAARELQKVADAFLFYNREIFNRTDDSVIMAVDGKSRLIRRSRGFVPEPVNLSLDAEGIFAAGAEMVNCFCIGRGRQAIMSQHIGDLQNLETLDFYSESVSRFRRMFRAKPSLIACDLHPDYLSTRFAEEMATAGKGLPVLKIQHHHAHIASCMAEHGLDEPVIGISMDGVGLGTDGHIWGFEIMIADLLGFERISHLDYVPQPGGDMATHEPWRMALSYILRYLDKDAPTDHLPIFKTISGEKIRLVTEAISNNINCPLTSSAGRLFDAVAAMTGGCIQSDFHAEAPMRLENIIDPDVREAYDLEAGKVIDPTRMIREINENIRNGITPSVISAKFHRAVVNAIIESALIARSRYGISKVVLSGGVFQNRYLLEHSIRRLSENGLTVFTQSRFPSNDGGIALGQLAIAAKRREKNIYI
jgi:hydrogenase maturation protein HypF